MQDGGREFVAKFSASTDTYDIVKAEYAVMRLAALAGLRVAPVMLRRVMGKDVLLVERFDRVAVEGIVTRRCVLSLLSLLRLHEMEARYASYRDFADLVRHRFVAPAATLRELFRRLVFNVLVGNTDDHARNHAALWDGRQLELSPAYDLCPQRRTGREASQAMAIGGSLGDRATLANVCSVAEAFLLKHEEARALIDEMVVVIRDHWDPVCDEAGMPEVERRKLTGSAMLGPFAFEGWSGGGG